MKKSISSSLIIILVLFSLFITSNMPTKAEDDVLKVRMRAGEDINNLDPAHHVREYDISLVLYSRLLRYKPGSTEVVPDAAKSVEVSDDNKTIHFELKKGIQFHDGYGELTAEDVKYSFERIIDPEENSEYASDWKSLDHVEVTGRYSGKIILKKPLASLFVSVLPFTPGNIVSKKACEELGGKFSTHPVGSGPYKFKKWTPQQKLVLERFDNYFGEKPDFKKIEVYPIENVKSAEMSFDRGELNLTEIDLNSYERYKSKKGVDVHTPSTLKYDFIGFNHQKAPFNKLKVRKAIRYAVNIDQIVQGAYNDIPEPANSMIAPGVLGHWENAPENKVDIEKAKKLLDEAGYADGFKTNFVILNKSKYMNVSQILKQQLAKIGVNLQIKIIETSAIYDYLGKQSHAGMYFDSWSLNLDPNYWATWFTSDKINPGWNFLKWSNEEYDKLVKKAATEMNKEKREELFIEMQEIMHNEVAAIWVTNDAKVYISDEKVDPEFLGHYQQYRYFKKVK